MFKQMKKILFVLFVIGVFISLNVSMAEKAEAYTFSAQLNGNTYGYNWSGIYAIGYNVTQGYFQNLPVTIEADIARPRVKYAVVTVPNDGSTWEISGQASGYYTDDYIYQPYYASFSGTVTTTGTFTGYSPKTATVAANTAATNALNAKTSADAAKTAANAAENNTVYNGQSAAYWAYLGSQDTMPPTIEKIEGLYGATCTTSGIFYVVVTALDNWSTAGTG